MSKRFRPPMPPWLASPMSWATLQEFARLMERPYRTLYGCAIDGSLASFGIRTYQSDNGRWWVELPPSIASSLPSHRLQHVFDKRQESP